MQKKNPVFKSNVEYQSVLQLFWKYLTCLLLTDAFFKFWTLCTKVFRLQNWSEHFTSSSISSRCLRYFMVDWTSLNERALFKFIQQKQSNLSKETVHFSKYSKHTLYTEQASFTKRSASFCSRFSFTLLRISWVFKEQDSSMILYSSSWQNYCNIVKISNTEFISLSISGIFIWNIDIMVCKCHRCASANSLSKNLFKIIGRLNWEGKNDFMAGNICSNHSTAGRSDSLLLLPCDNTCL
jgi:hypothetical protein